MRLRRVDAALLILTQRGFIRPRPPERTLLYAVAIQTGLRSGELRSLKRSQLFLAGETPFITCAAGSTKNGVAARQYIKPDLARKLAQHIVTKTPAAPVFDLPASEDVA